MAATDGSAAGQEPAARWWMLVVVGVLSVVAGLLAVFFPELTVVLLGIILGVNLLVLGTIQLVLAFDDQSESGHSVLNAIVGFLGALAGLVCLVRPGTGVAALLLATSFWFVVTGITEVVQAVRKPDNRLLTLLLGLIGIGAGVIILANPRIGLQTLALLAGLGFIGRGVLQVAIGFALRRSSATARARPG